MLQYIFNCLLNLISKNPDLEFYITMKLLEEGHNPTLSYIRVV